MAAPAKRKTGSLSAPAGGSPRFKRSEEYPFSLAHPNLLDHEFHTLLPVATDRCWILGAFLDYISVVSLCGVESASVYSGKPYCLQLGAK